MLAKIKSINSERIVFDNDYKLYSDHHDDCCESHYLCFDDIKLDDVSELTFDFDATWFNKIEGYGIELIPTVELSTVKIPGYGSNNGYYSTDLRLVLEKDDGSTLEFDIEECQEITEC